MANPKRQTAQVITLVPATTKQLVKARADEHGVSEARIVREVLRAGFEAQGLTVDEHGLDDYSL